MGRKGMRNWEDWRGRWGWGQEEGDGWALTEKSRWKEEREKW